MTEQAKYQKAADFSGVTFSLLCAIHCAITPLIFIAKPLLDHTSESHHHHHDLGWWGLLDFFFLVLSFVAVWYSAKYTSHQLYKTLLWGFWILFAISLGLEKLHIELGHWLTYLSAFALALTHVLNYRYCKKCKDQE